MVKRTIEFEDDMDQRTECMGDEIKELFASYCGDKDVDEIDPKDWADSVDDNGSIHEIVDSSVPVYTYDIKCLWFIYGPEFETAYDNAGIGKDAHENDGMTAIYCYLSEKAQEIIREIVDNYDPETVKTKKEAAQS